MRILTVCNVPLDAALGSAYVLLNYARYLRELGHDVQVVGQETFMSLPKLPFGRLFRMGLGMRRYIRKHAMDGQFDVIELCGGQTCYAARMLGARKDRECLVVAHTNGIEMHMSEAQQRGGDHTTRSHLRSTLMPVKDAFTKVDGIVTVSHFDLEYAIREQLLPESQMLAIENPLPEGYVGTPLQLQRKPVIGYCGGWTWNKGVDHIQECMLEVLEAHPHVTLKMIGVGTPFSKEKLFPQHLWHRIEVVPFVRNRTELKRHYEGISILLMPSVYESFGMVSTEGMACGCALVGTRTGFAASLKDGEEVMHVDLADKRSLPRAISALLNDDQLRQRIASNGWKRVQTLRWPEAASTLEAKYGSWLSELRAGRRYGEEI
jgi:glycosyltransferase involved in cell wall biosynthesis